MTGYRYRRLCRGQSIRELADMADVSPAIIRKCERGDVEGVTLRKLLAVGRSLELTVREGLQERGAVTVRPGKRELSTWIGRYMADQGLTARALAKRLGVSAQTASVQAQRRVPSRKYLEILAEQDGVNVLELLLTHGDDALRAAVYDMAVEWKGGC